MKISKIRSPLPKSRAWARQGLPVILQAPQGLGRPHLTLKVTSADKDRIITRSEEHKQDSNSHGFSPEVTSHVAGGSLQGHPAHTDLSPSGFLPDHFPDHTLYFNFFF